MNPRVAAIFVVLLVVLGGGALLYYQQERARHASNVDALGQPLLKDLKGAEVAAIRIAEPKATLTLEQKDGRWTILERDGFPADVNKARDFVLKLLALKVGQSEPIGDKDRARLALDDSGTRVELRAAGGKTLAALNVGKKYFKREPDNPDKAPADGRFVMLAGEAKTVAIVSDPLAQATPRSAEWIDRSSFLVEKVKALEVRYADGSGWKIERSRDDAGWKLAGIKPGEKLDISRANAASYVLGLLELADVAPKSIKPAETGLDKPTRVDATTLDGLSYAIKVGKLAGDNYYVSFSSSGKLAAAAGNKDQAERLKKIEERQPREKLLAGYVLLINKSKLEDTLKKRAEMLEKSDRKKK